MGGGGGGVQGMPAQAAGRPAAPSGGRRCDCPHERPRRLPAAPAPLQTSIYLASSPEVEGVSGKYFDRCRPVTSSQASYDAAAAARLWDLSAELVGL